MPQLIAWGNNVAGNLDTDVHEPYITAPKRICESRDVKEVIWASWTSTIIQDARSGTFRLCGRGALIGDTSGSVELDVPWSDGRTQIIGIEEPVAYRGQEGIVRSFGHSSGGAKGWKDVVMTGLGVVYGVSTSGIYRFKTLANFFVGTEGVEISHPALDLKHPVSLYATESRVLALSRGPLGHLFELKEDQDSTVSVDLVEDLEGLGIQTVIAGSANRFGVVTEAGDAYLIPKGSLEPELIELEDESAVKFVGVGSKFEVVVTEGNVWVRGESRSLPNWKWGKLRNRQLLTAWY